MTDSDSVFLLAQGATISVPTADEDNSNDVETLQEQLILLRSTVKALTDSLAIANSEAEMFKRQAADQTLKLEALGLAGVERDESKLEQRLLAAVRDLRLLKKRNEDAVNQLVRLAEAIQVMIKSSSEQMDPQMRLMVETELRKTNDILGAPSANMGGAVQATLTDGMVVDVNESLSLVVANIGDTQGVKIGMPFQVWREDKRVGEVRVVDVRDKISGAIIQSLDSEKTPIKVGDRLRVDARQ